MFDSKDELDKEKQTSQVQEVVASIVVLKSLFSIPLPTHLFNILKEDIKCKLDLLHSIFNIFINKDMLVRLLNLSFCNFFLNLQKRGKSLFWVNEKITQKKLASNCFQVLSSPQNPWQNICNLTSSEILRHKVDNQIIGSALPPKIEYTCRYLAYHLEQS